MENLDLRVRRTYTLLIHAFENLLAKKAFEKITVTEICEAAMIRRPTFYKHFLDKYDFLTFFIKHQMNQIFDEALKKLENTEENNFFALVFEQLLKQPDNLLSLIFSLQMRSDIMIELEAVQEFGQKMLKNHIKNGKKDDEPPIHQEYKAQIIMGLTIQSVQWYKNNQEEISQKEMTRLYKETLKKLE